MLLHGATIAARHAHPYHGRRRFIGSVLALRLRERGERITGLGLRPPLWLTPDSTRYSELVRVVDDAVRHHGLNIRNLGNVSREAITGVYSTAAALIYPSTLESYGLPLLEARAVGLPILTGELDYVRDVVDPEETFDPHSSLSIARAVKRFLARPEGRMAVTGAEEFVQRLLATAR